MQTQLTFLEAVIAASKEEASEHTAVTAVAECDVTARWTAESDPTFLESIALVKRAFREPVGSPARLQLVYDSFLVVQC